MISQQIRLCARSLRPSILPFFSQNGSLSRGVSLSSRIAPATPPRNTPAPLHSGCMRLSSRRLASLEDYYVNGQVATCIQSPVAYYVWFSWAFLMIFVTLGSLLHSNYYFSGRMLPKPSGNTQLIE